VEVRSPPRFLELLVCTFCTPGTRHSGQKLILPGGCSIRAAGAGLTVRCQNVDRHGRNGTVRPDLNLCGKYDHYFQNFDVSTGAFFGGPDERVVCIQ
jgi:hypothetical protein